MTENQILYDNEGGKIYETSWFADLLKHIKSNGNIEEFIKNKDDKLYESFLTKDAELLKRQQTLENAERKSNVALLNSQKANDFHAQSSELDKKVAEVLSSFPQSRQAELRAILRDFSENKTFDSSKLQNLEKPRGLIDRFKNRKKYKEGYAKLLELTTFCQKIKTQIPSATDGFDYNQVFDKILNRTYSLEDEKGFSAHLDNLEKELSGAKNSLETAQKSVENRKKEFPNTATENQIIRDFVEKNKESIMHPQEMSLEDVKRQGLTEEYIKGVVLQSTCPKHVTTSIRKFYEELKEPAAPRLAYNGRANKGKDIEPSAMVKKLQEKGLNAVLVTDERAKDPSYFVVNENSIFAPFLEPRDALKANVAMVEAIVDLGGTPALSNPQTREALVPAVERPENADNIQLDNFQINKARDADKLQAVISQTREAWNAENSNVSHLYGLIGEVKSTSLELYGEILDYVKQNKDQSSTNGALTEDLAKNILDTFGEKLEPYVYKEYQKSMVAEAFEHGMNPVDLDRTSKEDIIKYGYPTSVFHGGQQGANPYAVLCRENEGNMNFVYGAATVMSCAENADLGIDGGGSLGYAFSKSTHNVRKNDIGGYEMGFFYEYESRKENQEMTLLDMAYDFKGGKFNKEAVTFGGDETAILPHQNKLKKIYLAAQKNNQIKIFPLALDENGKIADKKWRDFVESYNPVDDNMKGNIVGFRNNMIEEYDTKGKEGMYKTLDELKLKTANDLDMNKENENLDSAQFSIGKVICDIRMGNNPLLTSENSEARQIQNSDLTYNAENGAEMSAVEPNQQIASMSSAEAGYVVSKMRMGNNVLIETPKSNAIQQNNNDKASQQSIQNNNSLMSEMVKQSSVSR